MVKATPQRNAGVNWALPIDRRLDDLVTLAHGVGENTTRKELIAAILADVEPDATVLTRMLKAYRTMTVRDLLRVRASDAANVISIKSHGPGPRRVGA